MPTILYWNINNFTNERINLLGTKRKFDDDAPFDSGPPGAEHLQMLINTLSNTINPANNQRIQLDFIVVVEVYGRKGTPIEGQLIGGNGATGCVNLRKELNRNLNVNGVWSLVPPVVTGTYGEREAIAIYYRRDLWYFLGPGTWPQAYPPDFRDGLPIRTIPPANPPNPAYPYRAGQPENRGAGQWQFLDGAGNNANAVYFPGNANRKPWLTAFGDVNNVNNLVRIMALHTKPNSPQTAFADQGTRNLANVYDVTARPPDAANQIDVIVGDFNVDNLVAGNFQAGGPFGRLLGQGLNSTNPPYTALVQPPNGLNAEYDSYYHTHGHQVGQASIAEIDEDNVWLQAGTYPGQRYSNESLDNALVRYQTIPGPPPPPPPSHMTILARAREQPYNPPANPAVMPMLGYYQSQPYMEMTIDEIYADMNNFDFHLDPNTLFRQTTNYKRVWQLSDHFALLFDV
jgi:hypothetical protein